MTVLIVIAVIIMVLILLLFIPSELLCTFIWNEYERKTEIKFKYLFFKKVFFPIKSKKKSKENKYNKKKYTFNDVKTKYFEFKSYYKEIKDDVIGILNYARKHAVTIKETDVFVKFDCDDPMNTGINVGIINGVVYNILGFIDRTVSINKMKVNIIPLFENRNYFDISVNGIVKIKNVHIMYMLIRAIKIAFKIKKSVQNKIMK